ncbi:Nif3-like dinuclear metal center hexameric protein [Paenibacillus sp. B01]|uniref:Nif3-like dinuclear metal center hexameric protein n=1 Tax=Paenibacillus sp. B01 TaxID=2660554 RepID=UPI00129AEB17|nr:Nif3-like dinuclear metal center hexameric protein [Paenibacillus sp. B01]QGG55236.1 transcriptional regulator [Paenibacillus sp. B01]
MTWTIGEAVRRLLQLELDEARLGEPAAGGSAAGSDSLGNLGHPAAGGSAAGAGSAPLSAGADGLLAGDPQRTLTGVAVSFAASLDALERAGDVGANLLVAHEGLYFSHQADAAWTAASEAAQAKRRRIEASGIAVCRWHDGPHRLRPDVITAGLVRRLGWEDAVIRTLPEATIIRLPEPLSAAAAAELAKRRLGASGVRAAGDLAHPCRTVAVTVGYRGGGELAARLYEEHGAELLLAGEGPEWEAPEYVRDAVRLGRRIALLYVGHAASEQPGMELAAERIGRLLPGVPVHFLSERDGIQII